MSASTCHFGIQLGGGRGKRHLPEIVNQNVCKTGLFVSAGSAALKGALIM